jgi:hypothetical protein
MLMIPLHLNLLGFVVDLDVDKKMFGADFFLHFAD